MFDYLQSLNSSTRVLDLGSSTGSFPLSLTTATVVRLDRDSKAPGAHSNFVQADAAALHFASQSFECGAVHLSARCQHDYGSRLPLASYYFGSHSPQSRAAKTNVCIRCGSGHSARHLLASKRLRRHWIGIAYYQCPNCGARNLFTNDDS